MIQRTPAPRPSRGAAAAEPGWHCQACGNPLHLHGVLEIVARDPSTGAVGGYPGRYSGPARGAGRVGPGHLVRITVEDAVRAMLHGETFAIRAFHNVDGCRPDGPEGYSVDARRVATFELWAVWLADLCDKRWATPGFYATALRFWWTHRGAPVPTPFDSPSTPEPGTPAAA